MMPKHHTESDCCFIIEEQIAWFIGCIDGFLMGCFFGCYNNDFYEPELVDDLVKGAEYGFYEGFELSDTHTQKKKTK